MGRAVVFHVELFAMRRLGFMPFSPQMFHMERPKFSTEAHSILPTTTFRVISVYSFTFSNLQVSNLGSPAFFHRCGHVLHRRN